MPIKISDDSARGLGCIGGIIGFGLFMSFPLLMMTDSNGKVPVDYQIWLKDGYGNRKFLQGGGVQGATLCDGLDNDGKIGGDSWAVGCENITWEALEKRFPDQRTQIEQSRKKWSTSREP